MTIGKWRYPRHSDPWGSGLGMETIVQVNIHIFLRPGNGKVKLALAARVYGFQKLPLYITYGINSPRRLGRTDRLKPLRWLEDAWLADFAGSL